METIETTQIGEKKRGGCVTAFLILMFIANPIISIYYIFAGDEIMQLKPSMPDWTLPVLSILGFANLVFAIAVWNWKRFGIYGFWISALIISVINFSNGHSILNLMLGFLGPLIITLLVRPKWNEFK